MSANPCPRRRCERCKRPQSHCLCPHIPSLDHRSRVIVLQHPEESRHPMNTARLAVLGLRHAELWVGERFPELETVLEEHRRVFLLFPGTDNQPALEPVPAEEGEHPLVLVPDGTWRKARQLIRANPLLQALPRLGLAAGSPSDYRIRRADVPASLATVEAVARVLALMEPEKDFQPLLRPFRVMVDRQIEAMGPEVYLRNHGR